MTRWSFTEHPASVGETYLQHLAQAASFSLRLIGGGVACLVHAVLPFLFTRTGSRVVVTLHERMVLNRAAAPAHRQAEPGKALRA
jgi:hypothetical protein